ncbi:MAG: crossover junction endodeoxyribonuclease RuvC [Desulfobulbus propionicus]|nr:MAG: crossover junction endodeoxyribonuclease RuvC [Desulfobulbus propionicus]
MTGSPVRILGIDPGSRSTGYGIIEASGSEVGFVACGTIRTTCEAQLPGRLTIIFNGLCEVILAHKPQIAAVEEVFVDRNPRSALKLGQARGAAIVAATQHLLPVFDYSARKVKQAVSGYGQAGKDQVQHMVSVLLDLEKKPSTDAADALAVALCHAQHMLRGEFL